MIIAKLQSVENLRWVELFWGIPQPQQACPGHRCPIRPLYGQCLFWSPPLGLPRLYQYQIKILAHLASSPLSCHRYWVCTMDWDFSYPVLCFLLLCVSWALPTNIPLALLCLSLYLLLREAQWHMHHKNVNNDINDVLDFFLNKNPLLFCLQ